MDYLKLKRKYEVIEDTDWCIKLKARYYNSGYGIAIVASITKGIDWASYIGADDGYKEEDCAKSALETGSKLSEEDARYFFPDIDLSYRR